MSELSRKRESEGYGACDDELSVFRRGNGKREAAFSKSRPKPSGASKIL